MPEGQEVRQPLPVEACGRAWDYKSLSKLILLRMLQKVTRHRLGLLPEPQCCGTPTTRVQELAFLTSETDS